tara:strand:- start:311 stop:778 length:468 start_codon:yes stop_codon:yes gene_type:complete
MSDTNSDNKIVYISNGSRESEIADPISDAIGHESEDTIGSDDVIDADDNPLNSENEENYLNESFEGGGTKSGSVYDTEELRGSVDKQKASYASSESSNESMTTAELLSVDPLYFRLNLFLKSDEGENVANLLKKVCNQMETLNKNFDKLLKTPSQ